MEGVQIIILIIGAMFFVVKGLAGLTGAESCRAFETAVVCLLTLTACSVARIAALLERKED